MTHPDQGADLEQLRTVDQADVFKAGRVSPVGGDEKFFLDAARTSGLTVPPNELVTDADGSAGLLIQRFDRVTVDGALTLLAVEDGCQVQGRPPADKYRLGADATFAALASVCQATAVASRDLIRQLVFAYSPATATRTPRTSPYCKDWTASGGCRPPTTHPAPTRTAT